MTSVKNYPMSWDALDGVSGVYAITAPSGSVYIGSAVNFKSRWRRHLRELRGGVHYNPSLVNAYAKYGEESLVFSVVLICDKKNVVFYEQIAIDAFDPKYNIQKIAGSALGIKRSAETRAKMSEAQRNRGKVSEETRARIGSASKGRKQSPEAAQKKREAMLAYYADPANRRAAQERNSKNLSNPETRAKLSEKLIGKKKSDETRAKMSQAQSGRISSLKGVPRPQWVIDKILATKNAKKAAQANAHS